MPDQIPAAPEGWTTADAQALHRARTDDGTRAALARAMWRRDYQPGPEAQTGGFVYEIADRLAPLVEQARAEERARCIAALRDHAARFASEADQLDAGGLREGRLEAIPLRALSMQFEEAADRLGAVAGPTARFWEDLRAERDRLQEELALLKTPPASTNADHTSRIRQASIEIITEMLGRGATPEEIADQVLVYTNVAMWAVEREMERVMAVMQSITASHEQGETGCSG